MPEDDVEARVGRLERDVVELREQVVLARTDASGARVLAAGADRDVSEVRAELRAHTQALNALRETQLEQGEQMRAGFTRMATGMAQITALLTDIRGSEPDNS